MRNLKKKDFCKVYNLSDIVNCSKTNLLGNSYFNSSSHIDLFLTKQAI